MAKISVSLSDTLKEQLDAYAEANELSISQTVQRALEQLLNPSSPPLEPPPPPITPTQDLEARDYLDKVAIALEMLRRSLMPIAPVPYPLPPPPWYNKTDEAFCPDPTT